MSAITGRGENRTILESASASSIFGTAHRTTSQPADARAAICAVVASTSCVFVNVIDWTTTGAPPPIATSPTRICARLPISIKCRDMPVEPPPTTWRLERPPGAILTTPGVSVPISSRAPSSPPTGSGLFPMRWRGARLVVAAAARCDPASELRAVPLTPAGCAAVRDPDRHGVCRGDPRMRRPATTPRLDRRRRSSRRTRACTSSAGRTPSRRGTRPGSRAGSTVSGWAGSSPPSRSSTGAAEPRRRRCSGSSEHLQAAGGDRLLDVQWATPHLASLGAVELGAGRIPRPTRRCARSSRRVRRLASGQA